MARKEPENFYRRQQEEANRIAAKQHRALVDLVKLAKSSNEELRKMRRAFEAFAEAVNGMKLEPFQVDALTKAGYRPPAHDDEPGAASGYMTGPPSSKPSLAVVDEAEGVSESMKAVMNGEKTLREHAHTESRAHRLGFGDVVEATGAVEVTPDDDGESFGFTVNLNADGELVNELPMQPATGVPVKLGGEVVGTADIFEDGTASIHFNDLMEIPAHHGEFDLFWKHELTDDVVDALEGAMPEVLPEEECADVSEARRTPADTTPQGYASGGYTGVSYQMTPEEAEALGVGESKFGVPINQLAGIVHTGELWGTAESLQHMRDLGLIAEGTITHETDAQLDLGRN